MHPIRMTLLETDLLGILQPITSMITGHAYAVIRVLRSGDVIFVVLKQGLDTGYVVIELPQRLHWSLRRLLIINRLNGVQHFYLEYMGLTYSNEPILRTHGGGFSTFL